MKFLVCALGLLSCGEPSGESHSAIVTRIGFAARSGDQIDGVDVSPGLDLDSVDGSDSGSCGRRDFIAPDGTRGIDNQFTFLFELVEDMSEEGTVEGIVQGSINSGRLLLIVEVDEVDDWSNDDSVLVRVFNGMGRPDLGSDGFIVPDQTFDRDPGSPVNEGRGRIVDGELITDPFRVSLPMAFFNVFFDLVLEGAKLRAEVSPRGVTRGILGGFVTIESILELTAMADAMQEIQYTGLARGVLPSLADAHRNELGRCGALSANLLFESRHAFMFDETLGPPPAPDDESE